MQRRVIFIVKKVSASRAEIAREIKSKLKNIRLNDIRIASNHVELDLFCEDLEECKKAIGEMFSIVASRIIGEDKIEDHYNEALKLFNDERFWEVHEVLENVWRRLQGEEKRIVHGIILLAAAMVHAQKERKEVALSLLRRAYEELRPFEINHKGFNIAYIKSKISEMIEKNEIKPFKLNE